MTEEATRRKVGRQDVYVSPELLGRIRKRVKEVEGNYSSVAQMTKALVSEFSDISHRALERYVMIAQKATDYTFGLYADNKISYVMLHEISTGLYDRATQDFLMREAIERKMGLKEVMLFKRHLRAGKGRVSVAEALKKATGEIPAYAPISAPVKKVEQEFGGMVDEIGKLCTQLRMKISQAIEILPKTSLDQGKVHHGIFEKVYLLRHFLKEQVENLRQHAARVDGDEHLKKLSFFLDEQLVFLNTRVNQYLDEISSFVRTEKELHNLRKENA